MTLRELDIKAATELLGWKWVKGRLLPPNGKLNDPGKWVNGVPDKLPRFSTVKDSTIILLKMTAAKMEMDGEIHVNPLAEGGFSCIMKSKNGNNVKASGKTFSTALTLCCFKIAGIEIDPEGIEYGDD